ncbi:MAG: hypothetical protein R2806_24000 [Saprospiraceae bacterium]
MPKIDCAYCDGTARVNVSSFEFAKCPVCSGKGQIEAPPASERVPCRYCKSSGRLKINSWQVKPCTECGGLGFIHEQPAHSQTSLAVIHLKGDKPYSDRKEIEEILQSLKGQVRICETYLNEQSLDLLKHIPASCLVQILIGPRVNLNSLSVKLNLFKNEYGNFTFKQYNTTGLHDRYIIDDESLMILGYGLQRVGIGSESFVVILNNVWIEDMKNGVITEFDRKWNDQHAVIL